jgi:hypothetical protein
VRSGSLIGLLGRGICGGLWKPKEAHCHNHTYVYSSISTVGGLMDRIHCDNDTTG